MRHIGSILPNKSKKVKITIDNHSALLFYCFISVSAVVRFKHTENGLNSNKTELLN